MQHRHEGSPAAVMGLTPPDQQNSTKRMLLLLTVIKLEAERMSRKAAVKASLQG